MMYLKQKSVEFTFCRGNRYLSFRILILQIIQSQVSCVYIRGGSSSGAKKKRDGKVTISKTDKEKNSRR